MRHPALLHFFFYFKPLNLCAASSAGQWRRADISTLRRKSGIGIDAGKL
jgi:hypothetical protein